MPAKNTNNSIKYHTDISPTNARLSETFSKVECFREIGIASAIARLKLPVWIRFPYSISNGFA